MISHPVTAPDVYSVLDKGDFPPLADPIATARRIAACRAAWGHGALLDALSVAMPREDAEAVLGTLLSRGDVVALSAEASDMMIVPARALILRLGDHEALCGLLLAETAETVPFDEVIGPPDWRGTSDSPDLTALAAEPVEEGDDPLAAWRFLGRRGDPRALLRWPGDAPTAPPAQIARLAALFGDGQAGDDPAALDDLANWAGLPADPAGMDDPSQRAVATLPEQIRAAVTAGPGSGKTHTIRARIAALDAQGISPARIVCIVYTRAAVRALSERCADLPGGSRPQIRTLDSLAADFAGIVPGGFDATIRAATATLNDPDSGAVDYMAGREHLIVDEAQDIVGPRRTFLLAALAALDPECGATVFGDPAQAIYDYADPGAVPLHGVLLNDHGFAEHRLERNHRTPPGPLRDFAHDAGHLLRTAPETVDIVADMRARIEEIAEAGADPTGLRAPDLHLFRSGAAMAGTALDLARSGVPCSIRGGAEGARPPALAPSWMAPMAQALCDGATLPETQHLAADDPAAPSPDALAALLDPLRRQGGYAMEPLVQALERGALPALAQPPGAVALSTIHASKGLEADHVALYLPREHRPDDDDDATTALEEARVLFVGASRARRMLSLRIVQRWMSRTKSGRYWRREGNSAVVRLSRFDAPDTTPMPERDALSGAIAAPYLIWNGGAGRWILTDSDGPLAQLPDGFGRDIKEIGAIAFPNRPFIPEARGWLRVRPATLARDGALLTVPVVEGFVRIGFAGDFAKGQDA